MNKRKMMSTAASFALGFALLAGATAIAAPASNYISSEKARQIALENAGLAAEDVTFIRTHLDYDDGRAEYEVEFYQGNMEYDYDIDAVSGSILSYDYDAEYYAPSTTAAPASSSASSAAPGTGYITAEAAKQAALSHAGVAESDTRRMEIGFDYEHGIAVYELEWKAGWREYSYEVNASTGDIVSYEIEYDD
ncbi:MAG TPA: PepSY domain-containing protein [Candidatus Eisenbergiella merdipullorum]|uniref:PepSY domain-containing protein n=1 Tax=Candidatus Eisenbergiella merdipullorum TaxID=2838553 RepID=A0A9D2I3S3_9FIRM|nr:PepSY domain-containing protein [Candidatus Eisenbergiella merdipullorum]